MGDIPIDWDNIDQFFPGDKTKLTACILSCFKDYILDRPGASQLRKDGGIDDSPSESDDGSTDTEEQTADSGPPQQGPRTDDVEDDSVKEPINQPDDGTGDSVGDDATGEPKDEASEIDDFIGSGGDKSTIRSLLGDGEKELGHCIGTCYLMHLGA